MKSLYYSAIFLCSLALYSCSNELDEITEEIPAEEYVTFNSLDSRKTETRFESGDAISVIAVDKSQSDGTGDLVGTWYTSMKRYLYDGGFSKFKAADSNPIVLPRDGRPLYYYAVYPYDVALGRVFVKQTPEDQRGSGYEKADLLVACTKATTDKDVNLRFSHVGAKVTIFTEGDSFDDVSWIELVDVWGSMKFDLQDFSVVSGGSKVSVKMRNERSHEYRAVVPPLRIKKDEVVFSVHYRDGHVKDYYTEYDLEWRVGKSYRYVLGE